MQIFKGKEKSKKQLLTLAVMGLMWIGGNAMATQVNVDSATKDMPGKVESTKLSVPVKTLSSIRFPMSYMNKSPCGATPTWP